MPNVEPFYMVSVPYTGTRFLRKILDDNGRPPVEQIHTYVRALWHHWFEGRVLCPIRDPMLHAIGAVHRGGPIRFDEFDMLACLATDSTHFFRVDTPDQPAEARALMDFLGTDSLAIDWTPEGQSLDVSGARARYTATGELPDPTWPDQLGDATKSLLRRLGYAMAWLEPVAV